MTQPLPFNVLRATAKELQTGLTNGLYTSQDVVNAYLQQIEKHNHAGLELNALISVTPKDILAQRTDQLDKERANGKARGPLHGIPVVLKDAIMTGPELGMPTTIGAYAFSKSIAKESAPVVKQVSPSCLCHEGQERQLVY